MIPAINETTGFGSSPFVEEQYQQILKGQLEASEEAYAVVLGKKLRRSLFCLSADFSDHDDALGIGVLEEQVQTVHKVCAVEGVASDPYAKGLSQAHLRRERRLD